jgi:hypothetical protein
MIYAEEVLGRNVDWKTLNFGGSSMTIPDSTIIPRKRLFKKGGLGKRIDKEVMADNQVSWSATSSDDERTGCSPIERRSQEKRIKGTWLDEMLFDMLDNEDPTNAALPLPAGIDVSMDGMMEHAEFRGSPRAPIEADVPPSIMSPTVRQRISRLEHEVILKNNEIVEYMKRVETLEALLKEKDAKILLLSSTSIDH